MNDCRCGHLKVGKVTESRNWNPDCPEHGVGTDWYTSPEQVAKREADRARLLDLYAQARAARAAQRLEESET